MLGSDRSPVNSHIKGNCS